MGATCKWHFSPRLSSGSPKIGSLAIYFEYAMKISYSLQKYLSNGVLHTLIEDDLTLALKGFVVKSQIPNLTPSFFYIITHAFHI
jgi:hypothetical protein